MGSTM